MVDRDTAIGISSSLVYAQRAPPGILPIPKISLCEQS
jgi:hypothetical protein